MENTKFEYRNALAQTCITKNVCTYIGIAFFNDGDLIESSRARADRNKYKILMFKCLKRGKQRHNA